MVSDERKRNYIMGKNTELKDYIEILWKKKLLIIIVTATCVFVSVLINILKPVKYGAVSKILITSPYDHLNNNLSLITPYSNKLFKELMDNSNFIKLVLSRIDKKYCFNGLDADLLRAATRLKFYQGSDIIDLIVEHNRKESLSEIVNVLSKSYVEQFNLTENAKFREVENVIQSDREAIQKKLDNKYKEMEKFESESEYTLSSSLRGSKIGMFSQVENKIDSQEVQLIKINAKIEELEVQIRKEKENTGSQQAIIDKLNSNYSEILIEKKGLISEISALDKNRTKLKFEIDNISKKVDNYIIKNQKFVFEKTTLENELRSFENEANMVITKARAKQIQANILELSGEQHAINVDFKAWIIFSSIGSFVLTVLFIWICLI